MRAMLLLEEELPHFIDTGAKAESVSDSLTTQLFRGGVSVHYRCMWNLVLPFPMHSADPMKDGGRRPEQLEAPSSHPYTCLSSHTFLESQLPYLIP